MGRKPARNVALALLAILVVVGGSALTAGAASNATIRVAVITPGLRNDHSYVQAHVDAIRDAVKRIPGVKLTAILDNRVTPQSRIEAIKVLAPRSDLIIGATASLGPALDAFADRYPKTYFISNFPTAKFHKNVLNYVTQEGLAAFVAGALAARQSKTNTVGVIGGIDYSLTQQIMAGFKAGAKYAKPNVKVLSNITGDYNDVQKSKEVARGMIADGADQIYAYLDTARQGIFQAANELKKNIGVSNTTVMGCGLYKGVLGSTIADYRAITFRLIQKYAAGTLKPGAVFVDLHNPKLNAYRLCPAAAKNPAIASYVRKIVAGINAGTIKVPAAAVNAFPKYAYEPSLK